MKIDKKTLEDLSVFHKDGGLFNLIDNTETIVGSHWLVDHCKNPPSNYEALLNIQQSVKYWIDNRDRWCHQITNGTIVMTEKFFTSVETITAKPSPISLMMDNIMRKILKKSDATFIEFSIKHIIDFVKGCQYLVHTHLHDQSPLFLKTILENISELLHHDNIKPLLDANENDSYNKLAILSYQTRRYLKNVVDKLTKEFSVIDGIRGMALATVHHKWTLPELLPSEKITFAANNFYHPLIPNAKGYSLNFDTENNFLFLTGANMSGKSTLIRSMGIGAYLAHLGIGVPAQSLRISYLNNLISNMQVEDNLFKGESYFYAEVLRMKHTAEQIVADDYNLVLMDELFKGTNVHDAYECSKAVIQSLLKRRNNLFALSTHLYELYDSFKIEKSIMFYYFSTHHTADGNYQFTYELRNGVSNDRIGYWVLKKEGVLDILNQ